LKGIINQGDLVMYNAASMIDYDKLKWGMSFPSFLLPPFPLLALPLPFSAIRQVI
jgi:hypothetical protein